MRVLSVAGQSLVLSLELIAAYLPSFLHKSFPSHKSISSPAALVLQPFATTLQLPNPSPTTIQRAQDQGSNQNDRYPEPSRHRLSVRTLDKKSPQARSHFFARHSHRTLQQTSLVRAPPVWQGLYSPRTVLHPDKAPRELYKRCNDPSADPTKRRPQCRRRKSELTSAPRCAD